VPGLNVSRGLSALLGNSQKYFELLERFVDSSLEEMLKLKSEDQASVQRLAHNLKSMADTLGIDSVATLAAALEKELRGAGAQAMAQPALEQALQSINHELVRLVEAMPTPDLPRPTHVAEPHDPQLLKTLLDQLDTLLAQHDTAAIALIEDQAPLLRSALGQSGAELVRLIRNFEFDPAHKVLRSSRPA
jgi:HPt (histidine-containing phosphotransfer) domain-containing protein